jgi:3-dehydroquinate synthase
LKKMEIQASTGSCQIIVDEPLKNLKSYLNSESNVVISDENVRHFYGDLFSGYEVIEIGLGEKAKTLKTVEGIYQRFLELGIDRSSFVIGIGGGIVCDITGFAASTFMRGVHFGFVPSTLLAQVDAGIGGKNGVNFGGYKNIVGVFKQPQFILLDFNLLKTLPEKERICGVAEIIKHALIGSPSLFDFLEKEWQSLLSLKREVVEKATVDSILIKSRIVQADERESGERRRLNFGHTLGHAVETVTGLPHGEAVSIGMMIAVKVSVFRGMLSAKDAGRIEGLLKNIKLPVRIPSRRDLLIDAIKKDKKRQGKEIHYVLLAGIGKAKVTKISYEKLEEQIYDLCEYR